MYKDVHCLPCLRYFFAVFLVSTPSISKGSRKRGIREHFANKPIKSKKSLPKRTAASTDTPPAPPKTRPAGTTWSIPWAAKLSLPARLRWYGAGFTTRSSDYCTAYSDGASKVRQFFSITLPLLSPTMFFVAVTRIIAALQVFDSRGSGGLRRLSPLLQR